MRVPVAVHVARFEVAHIHDEGSDAACTRGGFGCDCFDLVPEVVGVGANLLRARVSSCVRMHMCASVCGMCDVMCVCVWYVSYVCI